MKRAEILLSLAGVTSATAYILGNPAVALVGTAIMTYYALARLSFEPKVRVIRETPQSGVEREPLKAKIRVENTSTIPGIVRIKETSGSVFAKDLFIRLAPGEVRNLTQTIVPQTKGQITLRASARFEDVLGLFKGEVPVTERGFITVFPSPESIGEAMKERRQAKALAEAEKTLGIGAETLDFEELREFLPGDDIKRIDWKATSRLQKLILRVFKRENPTDVYLLVNVDPKFKRELKPKKTDYLALILVQLAVYFTRLGHPLRVIAYDDSRVVKTVKHVQNPTHLLSELDLGEEKGLPQLTPSPLSKGLSLSRVRRLKGGPGLLQAIKTVPRGAYVIIVDDLGLHPNEIVKAATILKKRGSRTILLYPNPVLFIDKSQVSVDTLETLYKAYRARKELVKKVTGIVRVIEVGPRDVLPKVVVKL